MHVITARNVHDALPRGVQLLLEKGAQRDSRNGPVLQARGPVTTLYAQPCERVMLWPERDANPFFHLLESLWMLAGRNDLAFPAGILPRFREFSDDGRTLHGAYGHRWRQHFGSDQIKLIIDELTRDPDSRRCVLQMWDAPSDLGRAGRDLPCNTHIYFGVSAEGALDMTVCCRSNDIIWGAYGANAVHFSVLQELMADALRRPVGRYWQISNNYHAYLSTLGPVQHLGETCADGYRGDRWVNPYEDDGTPSMPSYRAALRRHRLLDPEHGWQQLLEDCALLIDQPEAVGFRHSFIRRVAKPMLMAQRVWAERQHAVSWRVLAMREILEQMPEHNDWRVAAEQWCARRVEREAQAS